MRRAVCHVLVVLSVLGVGAACTPPEYPEVHAAAVGEAVAVAEPTSTTTSTTPPPPSHCADYEAMEAGRGHPTNQYWFDRLDARGYARVRIACTRGWGTAEWDCLDRLWTHESGWNHRQWNRGGSGAYGIPQSLPASKMRSHGADYMTNPRVQVRWGIDYIAAEYGRPSGTGCRGPY